MNTEFGEVNTSGNAEIIGLQKKVKLISLSPWRHTPTTTVDLHE
jgi:hypothetical protein